MMPKCPMPDKGESKQAYLSRCVRQCVDGGMGDADAFSACTLEAQSHNLSMETETQHFSGEVTLLADTPASEPSTEPSGAPATPATPAMKDAAKPRRFSILAHTGQIVDRWFGRMVFDLEGMRVEKTSIPALRDHEAGRIVGYTDSHSKNKAGLLLHGVVSQSTADGREVLALAEEGFPWQASIGVKSESITELKAGASMEVNGVTVEGPLYVVTQSTVQEISFCPLGADNNTAAIVMAGKEHMTMPDTIPAVAATDATRPQPQPAPTAVPAADVNLSAQPAVHLAGQPTPSTPSTPSAVQWAQQAVEQERLRTSAILALCTTHKLGDKAQGFIAQGLSLDQVREQVLNALATQPGGEPVGSVNVGHMTLGMAEGDKFRALAAEGIAMSMGLKVEKPQEGARQFMGLGLFDMARLALDRAGISTMGLSRQDVATALFSREHRLSASVADFSAVFMDVANKRLMQAYAEAGRTYDPWTTRVNARDFREMHGISLSEAPNLDKVGENEEYKTGSLKDGKTAYRVYKYGKILSISWEMIVNDDLNAFARIPAMLGAATARTFSDVVYGVLVDNKPMSDGKAIFGTDHKNLVSPASGITNEGLNAARLLMRMQTGMKGARLNLSPAFLLLPPSLENTALVLLKSAALPKEGMSAGVYNPWGDSRITPIVEQRLEPDALNSAKPWYLTAAPNAVSTIDVAYLDGRDSPDIIEHMDFNVDAFSYKARACIGAAAVDHRGLVKNPGVNS